jgi:phospholipid/cholesterol/gamma-HCH transport system permease protein
VDRQQVDLLPHGRRTIGAITVFQAGLQTSASSGSHHARANLDCSSGLTATIGSLMLARVAPPGSDHSRHRAVDALHVGRRPSTTSSSRASSPASSTTVLVVWSAAVAFSAGMLTGYAMFDIQPRTFLNVALVDAGDLTVGLAKCVAYGAAIPIVSGHSGLSTFGGSEGVGWATTRAVVSSSLAVIILDMFLSAAGFLVFR